MRSNSFFIVAFMGIHHLSSRFINTFLLFLFIVGMVLTTWPYKLACINNNQHKTYIYITDSHMLTSGFSFPESPRLFGASFLANNLFLSLETVISSPQQKPRRALHPSLIIRLICADVYRRNHYEYTPILEEKKQEV